MSTQPTPVLETTGFYTEYINALLELLGSIKDPSRRSYLIVEEWVRGPLFSFAGPDPNDPDQSDDPTNKTSVVGCLTDIRTARGRRAFWPDLTQVIQRDKRLPTNLDSLKALAEKEDLEDLQTTLEAAAEAQKLFDARAPNRLKLQKDRAHRLQKELYPSNRWWLLRRKGFRSFKREELPEKQTLPSLFLRFLAMF